MGKNWDTVQVRTEIKTKLVQIYEEDKRKPQNQKFNAYFDNLLSRLVEHDEQLKHYGPFIEYKDANENMIYLYDHRIKKSVDVYINGKKKELQCHSDNTHCCVHVGFCFAIPEVYKVLIEHGFKQPKDIKQ